MRKKDNFIVISEAGKPIFARHGREDEIVRICGLLQAIRTSINGNKMFDLGEIQSLQSGRLIMVFMTVGSITLVAISSSSSSSLSQNDTTTTTTTATIHNNNNNNNNNNEVAVHEAYLRVQLEYIFAQIIFTLTDQVQLAFAHNPGFDLRDMLTASESSIHSIINESSCDDDDKNNNNNNLCPFLVASVEPIYPIPNDLRDASSKALQSIAGGKKSNNNNNNNTSLFFAILLVGNKLLSLVQPSTRQYQLRPCDLHLILNFLVHRPGLLYSELWVPMCLPRFNSSGFLYAYTNCLDISTELVLVLISPLNTTDQFRSFQDAAAKIRNDLDLPDEPGSVLKVVSSMTNNDDNDDDGGAQNNHQIDNHDMNNDYNDQADKTKQVEKEANNTNDNSNHEKIEIESKRDNNTLSAATTDDDFVTIPNITMEFELEESPLVQAIKHALETKSSEKLIHKYMTIDDHSISHFLLRHDVAIKSGTSSRKGKGRLSQCISTPIPTVFNNDYQSRKRLWSYYHKLNLRLRLGSSTMEASMDAFDMITNDEDAANDHDFPGIARHCPAIGLTEWPPNLEGMTYILQGNELYLAMNGRDFELFLLASSAIPVKKVATLGARLVQRLLADKKNLFLSNPLTFKD